MRTEDGVEIRKLYIKLLDPSIGCEEIKFLLSVYGSIIEMKIFGKNVKLGWKMKNRGFVTFEKASAASCALINRKKFSELFALAPADTWNQPCKKVEAFDESFYCDQKQSKLFEMLNEDCLLHVITFLDVLDLLSLKSVCKNFLGLCEAHLKTVKSLKFSDIKEKKKLTLHEAKMVMETVGGNVTCASIGSEKFNNQRILAFVPKYLKSLKHLRLTGFKLEPINFWDQMAYILPQLETLDLSDNSEINENFLKSFRKKDTILKSLNVANCTVNGNFLKMVGKLESLNVSGCRFVTGKQLLSFVESNDKLKSLNISKCPNIFGKDVNELLQKASQLEVLSLNNYYIDDETSKFVIPSINQLINLRELTIHNINYPPCDQLLRTINLENRIEVLNISYGNLTLTSVYAISTMKSLRKLSMNFKNSVPEDFVDYLMELERLEELRISCCSYVSPTNALRLFVLPRFKLLDISRCCGYSNDFVTDLAEELKLNRVTRKIQIRVGQTEIDQEVLKHPKFKEVCEILQVTWEATKDVEHDYDIDEENKYEPVVETVDKQECFSVDGKTICNQMKNTN